MIGQTVSHYKIVDKLGEGGMGVVYKAQDLRLDRFVALKFLPPHLTDNEDAKKRFIHEAKAASALDHPNICNIYEIDETSDGRMFIAMACYEGESLHDRLKAGPMEVETALNIVSQVATGLSKAHEKDIPLAVLIAMGTDIIHNHPKASGEAMGKGSQIDFRIFTQQVSLLHEGGVYLNLGSAVILPEVFLKAVSLVRNSEKPLKDFTTANLDFIQHYRPTRNVVERPVSGAGTGIALTGHHEIMVPLLAAMLLNG